MRAHRGLIAFLLLSAACFDDEPEPRTREAFCRDWAAGACSEEVVSNCQARSAGACRETQQDFCLDLIPEDFSDRDGRACTDAVARAYADGQLRDEELAIVLKLGGPCDRIVVGSREAGESCGDSSECDRPRGYACVRKADSERGTCQLPDRVGAGRDCEAEDAVCEPGFYCDGSHCVESKEPGASCTIPEQCGEEGYCNDEGECAERLAVSEPCDEDEQCAEGICYAYDGEKVCTTRIILSRAEPICQDLK